MAIKRGNLEDQESSIKSRANEVFSDADDLVTVKSFNEYLQETPATPLAPEMKALLWVVALIVAMLFVGAILRVQRGGRRHRAHRQTIRSIHPRVPQTRESIRGSVEVSSTIPRMDPLDS
jgi:hypothetical protein